MFDRYKTLTAHYKNEIEFWNWEGIKKDALANCYYDASEFSDFITASTYLGSILHIFPSGKYYMPWTTNQTRSDCIRDECFSDALNAVALEHGLYITGSEGDGCDLLAQCLIDFADYDKMKDQIRFITGDHFDNFEQAYEEYCI